MIKTAANKQNTHLTYKANAGMGRHDWLRLTPAYSVHLVEKELAGADAGAVILDPFSGTGTTGLCAAEMGHSAYLIDVNPFLIWLAKTKTRNYSDAQIQEAYEALSVVLDAINIAAPEALWTPPIHNIERWWTPPSLMALARLKNGIENVDLSDPAKDLLLVAFCNTLIKESNAAFNHQSMSFKEAVQTEILFKDQEQEIFERYEAHCKKVIASASVPFAGSVKVFNGDSRSFTSDIRADLLITSPPYVNRMSYIRELRPYMYWLRYLDKPSEAGELDWKAIGGTWGTATSKLNTWKDERILSLSNFESVLTEIYNGDPKNGPLLSNYVKKYFYDMWDHLNAMYQMVFSGGRVVYIIGNSSFYGTVVPAEKWYAEIMEQVGFLNPEVEVIRKRNSKKELFEYAIKAAR